MVNDAELERQAAWQGLSETMRISRSSINGYKDNTFAKISDGAKIPT